MRLDLVLVRLRFAKSRTVAQRWIGGAHMRCNGQRVTVANHAVATGDVLTLPLHSAMSDEDARSVVTAVRKVLDG